MVAFSAFSHVLSLFFTEAALEHEKYHQEKQKGYQASDNKAKDAACGAEGLFVIGVLKQGSHLAAVLSHFSGGYKHYNKTEHFFQEAGKRRGNHRTHALEKASVESQYRSKNKIYRKNFHSDGAHGFSENPA